MKSKDIIKQVQNTKRLLESLGLLWFYFPVLETFHVIETSNYDSNLSQKSRLDSPYTYYLHLKNKHYTFLLNDGGLVKLRFDLRNDKYSLSYLSNPFIGFSDELKNMQIQNAGTDFSSWSFQDFLAFTRDTLRSDEEYSHNIQLKPSCRLDFDPSAVQLYHDLAHFHLFDDSNRFGVNCTPSVTGFMNYILYVYYFDYIVSQKGEESYFSKLIKSNNREVTRPLPTEDLL